VIALKNAQVRVRGLLGLPLCRLAHDPQQGIEHMGVLKHVVIDPKASAAAIPFADASTLARRYADLPPIARGFGRSD